MMFFGIHNINLMTNPTLRVTIILWMKMGVAINWYQHMVQVQAPRGNSVIE